ncbi:alpha/beta fold hydrolase [Sphingomonas naphthae]|uniref:Alpha/beta fold hydrolase n=1 Tax=Sphingomonas naphthae TaxID=1813468 RepID=A0ABY7TQZ6_9SPHN|nr:alpha/beta fold hydrolase [Sphingomonas naphthae]WCT74609.1 alpha/beta fold hydrolase [Sphingomonas naphthae]
MSGTVHAFGDVTLQSGAILPAAQLTYTTHGTLNADKSNAILFPTWFGGQHPANDWIIGPGRALDPEKYFIVVVNNMGNGLSSSPSNTPAPADGPRFPYVSVLDNVILQRRLLEEAFGIGHLLLIVGRSMGAQIAFQWGAYYPDFMDAILPFVGSARTAHHNWVFLENVRGAMTSDPAFMDGEYETQPTVAFDRMGLVFDSWGLSQAWYRQGLHLAQGYATTKDFIRRQRPQGGGDANNVIASVETWQGADLSDNPLYGGDYAKALGAITARTIVMPSRTDLYFPPEDSEIEVSHMPNAELRVIESVWGHRAGAPGTDPVDTAFIEDAIRELLPA